MQKAMSAMHALRLNYPAKPGTSPGSDFVVKARDKEVSKWKKHG